MRRHSAGAGYQQADAIFVAPLLDALDIAKYFTVIVRR